MCYLSFLLCNLILLPILPVLYHLCYITLPPQTVLLHGLLGDGGGHKTSKSWGKVIDPLDVINGASLEVRDLLVLECVLMFIGCGEQYLDSS